MSLPSQPVYARFVEDVRTGRQHDEKRNNAGNKTNLAVYFCLTSIVVAHDEYRCPTIDTNAKEQDSNPDDQ